MKKHIITAGLTAALLTLGACSDEAFNIPVQPGEGGIISLSGEITQECVTRANDNGFANGDVMGVYIVDYEGTNPGTLLSKGNRGDNVRHTFDEANNRWNSAYDLYWKDKHTRIDVYGYYPFGTPDDVNNYKFTVRTNQDRTYDDGTMGDYEASDFLWGKVPGVEPTQSVIRLPMTHRMANARVTLVEGSGFDAGEWAGLEKKVLVVNTVLDAVIDLATGTVTPDGPASQTSIIPSKRGDEWRAIVVPQTVPAGTTMFSITLGGIPYKFSKAEEFTYVAGKMNNFGIKVDKKQATGDYTLTLISESITAWENDLVSHDATAKEYVVVDVPQAGTLAECIAAAGKDLTQLRNLKITGQINTQDFAVMREQMKRLSALNLKEVEVINDEIPDEALWDKTSLTNLVFPDKLKRIGTYAFRGCSNLTGSLIFPEGLVEIGNGAFMECKNLTGTLSLPSTIKRIGTEGNDHGSGAFRGCNFTCELVIPEGLEVLGGGTFYECKNLYGSIRLPDNLKFLGAGAFYQCWNLTGSLVIPQGITEIPWGCFYECQLGGTLTLHDGIVSIGEDAFLSCGFKGELTLPRNLEVISNGAFYGNGFSGNLVISKGVRVIGDLAFCGNSRLSGILELPEGLLSIGGGAFSNCTGLEGIVFPESLEDIRYTPGRGGAFENCFGIGSIVVKGTMPPYVMEGAFDGLSKDNFTLEVPEAAIAQYQAANGWREFKRIAAHHELVCRPAVACAIGSERKQTLVLDAESDWELASKPDWCELSQTSGSKKTELTLTIKAMASTTDTREGDIVFRLKDKDYTHTCHVVQNGYEYAEDEYITLQKATKGNNGGINIVLLGDGYNSSDIAGGQYLADMKMQMENFFGIEPYTSYRDYFNVYTAIALSTESGVGSVNTIRYNRFNTTFAGLNGIVCDYDEVFDYALQAPTVNTGNLNQTLIIMVPNSNDYAGVTRMWETGEAISFCPKSDDSYPYDSRGVTQHEAGGHGFGKLADEYIIVNGFIDNATADMVRFYKSLGWFDNIELTGKMHMVGWSHLIFDPRYSDIVDIYEGGFMFTRGVFRSEQNSCMNNNIPYHSTISRESIVRRIKRYAGEQFDFEDFVAHDNRQATQQARSTLDISTFVSRRNPSTAPVIYKGSPLKKQKNNARKAKK